MVEIGHAQQNSGNQQPLRQFNPDRRKGQQQPSSSFQYAGQRQ